MPFNVLRIASRQAYTQARTSIVRTTPATPLRLRPFSTTCLRKAEIQKGASTITTTTNGGTTITEDKEYGMKTDISSMKDSMGSGVLEDGDEST